MFSWFLKILGINEDKPVSSTDNTFLNEKKQPNKHTEILNTAKPEPEPEPVKSVSLAEAYPGLKANYITVLEEAGFTSKALIDKADDKKILALKGIGQATLMILRS